MNVTRITLPIRGLACAGSSAHIVERCLSEVAGVLNAYVNPVTETAYVDYDAERCDAKRLGAALDAAGYHAVGSPGGQSP